MFSLVATNPTTNALTQYVFDNIPRVLHEQSGVVTLNPVQDGAPIGDHFYVIPARLTVEILMSDSMQSYTFGQFSDGVARSVSCWQTLKALQAAKAFITISSRLDTYDNMLITDRRGEETVDTAHAGRFTVTFTQVILATVTLTNAPTTDSTRPQATAQTQAGQVQPQVIPSTIQTAYKPSKPGETPSTIPNTGVVFTVNSRAANVPGAGQYSSTPYTPYRLSGPGETPNTIP
jgi:hypothetical protein